MSIIAWIVLGLIAGWLAGVLVRGAGYGMLGDIVLGILGALVGGWIISALLGVDVSGFNLESLFIAVFGAIVIRMLGRAIYRCAGPMSEPRVARASPSSSAIMTRSFLPV